MPWPAPGWMIVTSPLSAHTAHQLEARCRQEACFLSISGNELPYLGVRLQTSALWGHPSPGKWREQQAAHPCLAPGITLSALGLSEVTGPPAWASLGAGPGIGVLNVICMSTKV